MADPHRPCSTSRPRRRGRNAIAAAVVALLVVGCDRSKPGATQGRGSDRGSAVEPTPWSAAWLERAQHRYLTSGEARRAALEASLTNPTNHYSRQRLEAYGLGDRGWDVLPPWNPRSRPMTAALAATVMAGTIPEVPTSQPPLWDGRTPATPEAWRALGRRVFFEYPLRVEVFMEFALARPELADAVGVERTADGAVPGLVVFANVDGRSRVGITCAICHTTVREGELVVGAARRRFDYGRLRSAYFAETGAPVEPGLVERMSSWGPGRADVTEDNDEDPVAIPDLWGLRAMAFLTQAGTIRHDSPLALAIRQETQLLHTNHQRVRPPRELAWALAMFLYDLAPPPQPAVASSPQLERGAALFATTCAGCHANDVHGGTTVAATTIGTDPALANGTARGTGRYRVPSLVGIADGAPYLHDGSIASLDELLSAARLEPGYLAGRLGPGPIPGHRAGTRLEAADRAALIAYVSTL